MYDKRRKLKLNKKLKQKGKTSEIHSIACHEGTETAEWVELYSFFNFSVKKLKKQGK